jgi:hypothetical protein
MLPVNATNALARLTGYGNRSVQSEDEIELRALMTQSNGFDAVKAHDLHKTLSEKNTITRRANDAFKKFMTGLAEDVSANPSDKTLAEYHSRMAPGLNRNARLPQEFITLFNTRKPHLSIIMRKDIDFKTQVSQLQDPNSSRSGQVVAYHEWKNRQITDAEYIARTRDYNKSFFQYRNADLSAAKKAGYEGERKWLESLEARRKSALNDKWLTKELDEMIDSLITEHRDSSKVNTGPEVTLEFAQGAAKTYSIDYRLSTGEALDPESARAPIITTIMKHLPCKVAVQASYVVSNLKTDGYDPSDKNFKFRSADMQLAYNTTPMKPSKFFTMNNETDVMNQIDVIMDYIKNKSIDTYDSESSGSRFGALTDIKLDIYRLRAPIRGGGKHFPIHPSFAASGCLINPNNRDDACLYWATLIALNASSLKLDHPGRVSQYKKLIKQGTIPDLKTDMLPKKPNGELDCVDPGRHEHEIALFEQANNLAIRIYSIPNADESIRGQPREILRLPAASVQEATLVSLCLVRKCLSIDPETREVGDREHYLAVTNVNGLMATKDSKYSHTKFVCHTCQHVCWSGKALAAHNSICSDHGGQHGTRITYHEGDDVLINKCQIRATEKLPNVIIWDSETQPDLETVEQEFKMTSFGAQHKCREEVFSEEAHHQGEDAIDRFFDFLFHTWAKMDTIFRESYKKINVEDIPKVPKRCETCREGITAETCHRDHDHFTGAFRKYLCRSCNARRVKSRKIHLFAHNSSKFDTCLIVRAIKPDQFAGHITRYAWEKKLNDVETAKLHQMFSSHTGSIIDNTSKWIRYNVGPFVFLDSCRHRKGTLDELVAKMPAEKMVYTKKLAESLDIPLEELRRKLEFPYKVMTLENIRTRTDFPTRAEFYSELKGREIPFNDYLKTADFYFKYCKNSWSRWMEIYQRLDVALLTDMFEDYRNMMFNEFEIDPAHFVSLPSAGWACLLHKFVNYARVPRKASRNLLKMRSEEDLLDFVEGRTIFHEHDSEPLRIERPASIEVHQMFNTRGGVVNAPSKHASFNDYEMDGHDKGRANSFLASLDVNGLYPSIAFLHKMPICDFEFMPVTEKMTPKWIRSLKPEGNYHYQFNVDLSFPKEHQDRHTRLPLVWEVDSVSGDALSYRQYKMKGEKLKMPEGLTEEQHEAWEKDNTVMPEDLTEEQKKTILSSEAVDRAKSGGEKLIGSFYPKKGYTVDFRKLQWLIKRGVKIDRINSVVRSTQSDFLSVFVGDNIRKRAACKDETLKELYKLLNNSVAFGKFLQKPNVGCDVISANPKTISKAISGRGFRGLVPVSDEYYIVRQDSAAAKLETPVQVGASILDLSKMRVQEIYYDIVEDKENVERGVKAELLYGDTDSLFINVTLPDGMTKTDWFKSIKRHMDFNNYPEGHDLYDISRKGDPLLLKNETVDFDAPVSEFIALRPKVYAYKFGDKIKCKCKGVATHLTKKFTFKQFEDVLHGTEKAPLATSTRICSYKNLVRFEETTKKTLSAFDDKMYLPERGGFRQYPHGYWRNKSENYLE